jgi:hypothetical protein
MKHRNYSRAGQGPQAHNFSRSLSRSRELADAPWWTDVYRSALPGFSSMTYVGKDGWAQRGGIDRVITLKSGKTVTIDEKVRDRTWRDILLERWSDKQRQIPGWIQQDLGCDFIAYVFLDTRTCHLLPYLQLRAAWLLHGRQWIEQYPRVLAVNAGYVTESVAVPIPVIMSAIIGSMTVSWSDVRHDISDEAEAQGRLALEPREPR